MPATFSGALADWAKALERYSPEPKAAATSRRVRRIGRLSLHGRSSAACSGRCRTVLLATVYQTSLLPFHLDVFAILLDLLENFGQIVERCAVPLSPIVIRLRCGHPARALFFSLACSITGSLALLRFEP